MAYIFPIFSQFLKLFRNFLMLFVDEVPQSATFFWRQRLFAFSSRKPKMINMNIPCCQDIFCLHEITKYFKFFDVLRLYLALTYLSISYGTGYILGFSWSFKPISLYCIGIGLTIFLLRLKFTKFSNLSTQKYVKTIISIERGKKPCSSLP